ncbi:MAG TPA: twin-arginine translocase subunit TatC [Kiloniellales bacterium]|nr:twin-arginine translocase subunit TatC [Kiloniellales bacterium]
MKSDAALPDDRKMPLLDHILELRNRLLWCVAALLVVFLLTMVLAARDIYNFLAQPLADILLSRGNDQAARMIFTDLTEPFFTRVKVSFFFAAFICSPVILAQIWMFVAPGLYKHEKKALAPFLVATPILFLAGAALVYYLIMPMAWQFFLSFEQTGNAAEGTLDVVLDAKVSEYLNLVMLFVFAFGLAFQLPVIMTLLARVGIASSAGMIRFRRYAIVLVFIFAAIFTPPDPISQLTLAIPLLVLYEVSIQLAKMTERKRVEAEARAEAESAEGSA